MDTFLPPGAGVPACSILPPVNVLTIQWLGSVVQGPNVSGVEVGRREGGGGEGGGPVT